MDNKFEFKNGSYIKVIKSNENKRPTNIKFKEITDIELAEIKTILNVMHKKQEVKLWIL